MQIVSVMHHHVLHAITMSADDIPRFAIDLAVFSRLYS